MRLTKPSRRPWLLAAAAAAAAAAIATAATLPAEYRIDPTGLGQRLGLLTLAGTAQAAEVSKADNSPSSAPPSLDQGAAALAVQAEAVFGKQAGQSFDAQSVVRGKAPPRTETVSIELAPGKGAEAKAMIDAGDGFVFHWTASGDVAVDMHGERPEAKDEYTSYWIEGAQREGTGQFVAPFAGQHGWYWLNRGKTPVMVKITVTGFQKKLFRPGQPG